MALPEGINRNVSGDEKKGADKVKTVSQIHAWATYS